MSAQVFAVAVTCSAAYEVAGTLPYLPLHGQSNVHILSLSTSYTTHHLTIKRDVNT